MCIIHPEGGAVDGVDAAERTTGDDFLYFAVVLAVTMPMTDDGFYTAGSQEIPTSMPSRLLRATGFSKAIRRAPDSMPCPG